MCATLIPFALISLILTGVFCHLKKKNDLLLRGRGKKNDNLGMEMS
jgi:hypothetical protein